MKPTDQDFTELEWSYAEQSANWATSDCGSDHGLVYTYSGIVEVLLYDGFTLVRTVSQGRVFSRRWERSYSRQYAVTLARRFAEHVKQLELSA